MPSDVRIIVFTPEDVLEAIEEFDATAAQGLFRGKAIDCHVRKQPRGHAILEVERAAGEEINTVNLNAGQLAAALISFCQVRRIPLPRNARNKPDVIDDQLVLRLEVGAKNQAVLDTMK